MYTGFSNNCLYSALRSFKWKSVYFKLRMLSILELIKYFFKVLGRLKFEWTEMEGTLIDISSVRTKSSYFYGQIFHLLFFFFFKNLNYLPRASSSPVDLAENIKQIIFFSLASHDRARTQEQSNVIIFYLTIPSGR